MTRLCVVGRDVPLWLAVNVLHTALAPVGVTVEAVELPSLLRPEDVHATQPALEALHRMMGIDESKLLQAVRGTFSLGQKFSGFNGAEPPFFHAYGSYGSLIDAKPFFPFWLKARAFGLNVAFEDFSLTAAAAKQGRMLLPDATTEAFGRTDYGYHLPAAAYAVYLRDRALKAGVAVRETHTLQPVRDNTGVAALDLGGDRVTADLFVDATGAEARLIGALEPNRHSWRPWFPCDRVLTSSARRFTSIPIYAQVQARSNGWIAYYPSQAATHLVHAYAGARVSDDAALRNVATATGMSLSDAVVTVSDPGRRARAWVGNCIAIGEAACVFDPIDGVDLLGVQTGLVHLLSLFPAGSAFAAERTEYNRILNAVFDNIRDFQAVHYLTSAPPATLAQRIDTFRARGVVPGADDDSFSEDAWRAVLLGHGIVPESYDPRIDRTAPEIMKSDFRAMLGFIREQVTEQSTHDAYLELFCGGEVV